MVPDEPGHAGNEDFHDGGPGFRFTAGVSGRGVGALPIIILLSTPRNFVD
jgi:hypothetical protein